MILGNSRESFAVNYILNVALKDVVIVGLGEYGRSVKAVGFKEFDSIGAGIPLCIKNIIFLQKFELLNYILMLILLMFN